MDQAALSTLLDGLIATWENEVVEFKQAGNDYDSDRIGEYFSALSNEANLRGVDRAWLVFGVHNKSRAVVGTAYRLAAGAGFGEKLLGLGQTVGAAFADFAPGLAPFDWLVGIVGAAVFRLLIYFKSKNAKKYRRDAEYGSARWSA